MKRFLLVLILASIQIIGIDAMPAQQKNRQHLLIDQNWKFIQ